MFYATAVQNPSKYSFIQFRKLIMLTVGQPPTGGKYLL